MEGEGWRRVLVLVFATKVWKVAKLGDSLAMESCTLIWALVPKRCQLQGCLTMAGPLERCDWLRVIQFLPWNAAWLLAKQYIMSEFRRLSYSSARGTEWQAAVIARARTPAHASRALQASEACEGLGSRGHTSLWACLALGRITNFG
jgi:hypothetical protein